MTGPWGMVVVHHRDPDAVRDLLRDVAGWTAKPELVVVVDNSGELPDPLEAAVPVEVVRAPHNPGYAAAANLGMRRLRDRASPELGLLCTQDAWLAPDAAERLTAAMADDGRIALAAPVLAYRSDPGRLFSTGGRLGPRGEATHLGRDEPTALAARVDDVDWSDGAVNLVRLDAVAAVGWWDERYFLYVEEVDLQWRLRRAGFRVVIVRDALAAQQPGRYPPYLRFRNSVAFTRKFAGDFGPWPWRWQLLRQTAKSLLHGRPREPFDALRGVLAARRDRLGPHG